MISSRQATKPTEPYRDSGNCRATSTKECNRSVSGQGKTSQSLRHSTRRQIFTLEKVRLLHFPRCYNCQVRLRAAAQNKSFSSPATGHEYFIVLISWWNSPSLGFYTSLLVVNSLIILRNVRHFEKKIDLHYSKL